MEDFEKLAESMGINIVKDVPSNQDAGEQTVPADTNDVSDVLKNTTADGSTETQTSDEGAAPSAEAVETAGVADGEGGSDQKQETAQATEDKSDQSFELTEDMVIKALTEMVGLDSALTKEDLIDIFSADDTEAAPEMDPTVKAIADFVAETGRPVEDWFKYQSFNPSEMDDLTVVKTQLMDKFPDITAEDAQLLLDRKYNLNEDEYSENDVRLGKVQLKMDAKTARAELEKVREQFKAPVKSDTKATASAEASFESPINDAWIAEMSKTVDSMEQVKFNLGDKDFNFALKPEHKDSLKRANSDLENYFVQYVDNKGNWDFSKLSQHRMIIDNIDSIVKSVYGQGLSDGRSEVVKDVVNPSVTAPHSSSVDTASAEDKVRQQILNALKGGDDTLRIRF